MATKKDVKEISEYLALNIIPPNIRDRYYQDIRSMYKAEPLVYLLQYVALSLNSIFISLASSYFYDWLTKKKKNRKLEEIFNEKYNDQKNKINEVEDKLSELPASKLAGI